MNRIIVGGAALAALALSVGAAEAHPKLLASNPAAAARVRAPTQLRLSFSETLIGRFSQLSLADSAGRSVPLGPSALSQDHKQLIAAVRRPLAPGTYRVSWRAVSTDTHRVQGGYAFTVTR
jgi:methionine-rich copper-binding protein CopC